MLTCNVDALIITWLISHFKVHPGRIQWSWTALLLAQFDQGKFIPDSFFATIIIGFTLSMHPDRTVWAATGCQSQTPLDVITSHLRENAVTGSVPAWSLGFSVMSVINKKLPKDQSSDLVVMCNHCTKLIKCTVQAIRHSDRLLWSLSTTNYWHMVRIMIN